MKKYYIGAVVMTLLVSVAWPMESRADTTRKSITPLLNASAQYDSNYFKTDKDKEDVTAFLVQPGIEAAVVTERSHLSLYYTLDAYFYEEDTSEDLDFIGHTLRFDAGTRSRSERLIFRVKDNYYRSRNPSYTDNLTTSVNRAEYGINIFNPEVQYIFGNALFALGYTNVMINYDNGDDLSGEDSKQNWGTGKIDYSLDKRNTVGVKFDYWEVDYDDRSVDYDAWQAMATYCRWCKYFTLEGGAGWQDRNFDSQSVGQGEVARQLDDIDDYLWYVALGGVKGNNRFTLRADSNFNVDGQGDQYYRTNKLALFLGHTFVNSKLEVGLKGSIQNSDYEFSGRDDDIYSIEASAQYPLTSWLTVSGAAGYEDSDSNKDQFDYDNSYGMLMFKFRKPIGSGNPVISK